MRIVKLRKKVLQLAFAEAQIAVICGMMSRKSVGWRLPIPGIAILILVGLIACEPATDAGHSSTVSDNDQAQESVSFMRGPSSMREASFWLAAEPGQEFRGRLLRNDTLEQNFKVFIGDRGTAIHQLRNLTPGSTYECILESFGYSRSWTFETEENWPYREEPPELMIALGSCNYINESAADRPGKYGGDFGIFDKIVDIDPDMMIWLGDNTYFRPPDWTSESGIWHRRMHTRRSPSMANLLTATEHYAIWDDHDYGPNDSNGSYYGKAWARESFDAFWPAAGPSIPGLEGTVTSFQRSDADFFFLDNRWNRDLVRDEPVILGRAQEDWLIRALASSQAHFKFVAVGGQFLSDAPVFENHVNLAPQERRRILDKIAELEITGVIFLTGDRHHSELSAQDLGDGLMVYDFTVSPLTSKPYPAKEENSNLIPESLVEERNFGSIELRGTWSERELEFCLYDAKGKKRFSQVIPAP